MEHEAEQVDCVSLAVLGPDFIRLSADSIELREDFLTNKALVKAQIKQQVGENETHYPIEGQGVGLIDAYFEAVLSCFSKEYVSLGSVSIIDFSISIKMTGKEGRHTDAIAIALLRVKNSDRCEYTFHHKSSSITRSSIGVVQDTLQFFINAERAYTKLYFALDDAHRRARSDLVQKYQIQMSTLVKATSYKQIAERLKADRF